MIFRSFNNLITGRITAFFELNQWLFYDLKYANLLGKAFFFQVILIINILVFCH